MVSLIVAAALAAPVFGQTPTPVAPDQPPVLALDDAIAIAVQNNPGLAITRERVNRAENQLDEAKSAGRFKVNLSAGPVWITPSSTFTPSTQTTATTTVTQPVDVNGRISLGKGLASLQINVQELGEVQTLQQLIADVKNSYYIVLRTQGTVDTTRAAIAAAEENLRIARAQFGAGVVAKFDVTSAEVDLANLQQNLLQAEGNVQIAMALLNRIMGVDINRPFRLEEQVVSVAPVTIDIDATIRQAMAVRPEIRQAETSLKLAEQTVHYTKTEDDPSLALFATTDWSSATSVASPNNTSYTFGASVSWPIWTGGATRARVAEARNDVEIARKSLEQTSLVVGQEVRTSATNVMESSRRVQTAQSNVNLAEESLRLSRLRYQEGVTPFVEVSNAEAALTQARTNFVSARYDYLNAVTQLQRATASQPEYAQIVSPTSAMKPMNLPAGSTSSPTTGGTVPQGVNK